MNNTVVARTAIENYDDCTMLKVCARGDIERIAVPVVAIFIEMEKAGLCCTHPERSDCHTLLLLIMAEYECMTRTQQSSTIVRPAS